ncbi:MAG: hypothetical protein ACI9OJ_003767, partial [Myxococcota bacterium]
HGVYTHLTIGNSEAFAASRQRVRLPAARFPWPRLRREIDVEAGGFSKTALSVPMKDPETLSSGKAP